MRLGIQLKDSHKDIHTSRIPAHVPSCGHLLHSSCFTKLLESGGYACPICNKSLINMTRMWRTLDLEISQTPMPEEYREFYVLVLCRDCNKKSKVKFHVLGLKCMECGSYNTSREGEEGVPVVPRPAIGDPAADNEDGWETEEEEEIVGGEEEPAANGNETRQQQDDSISDELNIADVVINVDGDRDSVLPLD
ncbi:RING finger and CHY zinc finger domain-containing protein 1-like isoform X2 [Pocillopora verrucosa]|uniref:RING finger and CHY zinc finger domain-containing protein 1-like isoform X2 n=1 Tax=Pocillopora verrucosa TaxID=203993 RepID=UPI00333EFF99